MPRAMASSQHADPNAPASGEESAPGVPDRQAPRWPWILLAGILLCGAGVRGLYLREIADAPDFDHPAVDAGFHDYWARGLATGDWSTPTDLSDPRVRRTPFFRPPGYPYFLAGVYWVFGPSYLAARIAQMLLGLANCVWAFAIGRRFFRPAVGVAFAAGMALYWGFVYFEGELHAPALLVFLLLGATYVLGRWAESMGTGWAVAASALLGLGALVRPNVGLLVPAAIAWACWVALRRGRGRRVPAAAAALLLPALVPVGVTAARNLIVADESVLISSNAGINLYIGNNPRADGLVAGKIDDLGRFGTCFDYPAIVQNLERRLGRPLTHAEASDWFAGRAWAFIRSNPGRFLRLLLRKLCLFWGPAEVGHNKEVHYERASSGVLRWLPASFALVLALALVGLARAVVGRRRGAGDPRGPTPANVRGEVLALAVVALVVLSVSILPFFVAARYRVPVVPFLLLLGAYGVVGVGEDFAARRRVRAGCWVAVGGLTFLGASHLPCGYEPPVSKWHLDRGCSYLAADRPAPARRELEAALRADPGNAQARYNLGVLLHRQGALAQAVAQWREALRLEPDLPKARHNLAMALLRAGKADAAIVHLQEALRIKPDFAAAHNGLGMALVAKGRLAEAVPHWLQAASLQPRLIEVRLNLGRAMLAMRRPREAVAHLEAALRIDPEEAHAHYGLGEAKLRLGELSEAARHFAAAVAQAPGSADAHFQLGQVRHVQGRIDQAVGEYRQALALDGRHAGALNNLAWLRATHPDGERRDAAEAVRLAEALCRGRREPGSLDTLAAAYAEAGRFEDAVATVREAIGLAEAAGSRKVNAVRERLKLYQAGQPYREKP